MSSRDFLLPQSCLYFGAQRHDPAGLEQGAEGGAVLGGPGTEYLIGWYMRNKAGNWLYSSGADEKWSVVNMPKAKFQQLIPRPAKPRWRYHWVGPCPDFAALIPEYMMRDGCVYEAVNLRTLRWDHIGSQGDIIAYRLPD